MINLQNIKIEYQIIVLIFSALLVQLLSRYYSSFFVINHFNLLSVLLRFGVPVVLSLLVFKFSFKQLGFSLPIMKGKYWFFFFVSLLLIPIVMKLSHLSSSYFDYYSDSFADSRVNFEARLKAFSQFTLSTLFGWEFVHRSYLLLGLFCLFQRAKLQKGLSESLALSITTSFEVLYHFLKPDLESWGMLLASPVFCLITFRTRSILLPVILHLYIEIIFIFYAISF